MRPALFVAIVVLAACRTAPPTDPSAEERRLQPDHAPTPYTAERIREGCPDGRVSTFLIEVAGRPPMVQVFRFSGGDKEGCDVEVAALTTDDKPMAEPKKARSLWGALQKHASFPAAETRISGADVVTPAGRFDCVLYTVTKPTGTVERYYFARNLPGPPVRMVREAEGKRILTMTLTKQEP